METTIDMPANSAETQGEPQPDLGKRVSEAAQQVGESFRENVKVIAKARQSTLNALDGQKHHLADQVRAAEKTMCEAADRMKGDEITNILSKGTENFAHRVGVVADYLEQKELRDMAMDARDVIRQHPAIAFGAIFAAGLALGRFLKATEPAPPASVTDDQEENANSNAYQEEFQNHE